MEYKYFGGTGVKVSQLCFGTMSFGGDADEPTSIALYKRCRDAGINFFDCANTYAGGKSEEILGRLIADHRSEVVITSKVYFPTSGDINARGGSRKNIKHAVEASLKRLNTDYIDVYFLHRFDDFTPLPEVLRAMDDLIHQGKILYTAASNFAAWQMEKALGISAKEGLARFEAIQPMYNLVKRQAEIEILPMALAENVAVISYSPLGGGLLTGKYGVDKRPDKGRLVENKMYTTRYGVHNYYETADAFTVFAADHGYNAASLAVAWVGAHPAITAPIIGARNLQQLEGSLGSLDIRMTPELYAQVSALSPTPAPATDRNEEVTQFNYGAR